MAASDSTADDSLYPIAVLIDELKNEDVQVGAVRGALQGAHARPIFALSLFYSRLRFLISSFNNTLSDRVKNYLLILPHLLADSFFLGLSMFTE